jgi:D-tagatose-1,6-bisphosphate aldolase subunit GatZ/KbaZ
VRKNAQMASGLTSVTDALGEVVHAHRAGAPVGITSVCSAQPLVLEATMRDAASGTGPVLVEATSNQVDQTGGYTGMHPEDFRKLVSEIAGRHGIEESRLILGGDHLGPNRWRARPADEAMDRAEELVAAYARAGYTKIHLDCSMPCGGDTAVLTDAIVSARAARLLRVVEETAPDPSAVSYVIGTEVPVPGGAAEAIDGLVPTTPDAAAATLTAHRAALHAAGVADAWPRVRALVVQPGVEFDEWHVVDYAPERTVALQRVLDDEPHMVFEAHSTDYQTPDALAALVRDHWAILKVGPALTFALREALFSLEAIERELCADGERSRLSETLEEQMLAEPADWERYYGGGDRAQRLARRYSFSDRLRYYWPGPAVRAAEERLLANLAGTDLPLPLLSQHLPAQYARIREGELAADPRELVVDQVCDVLRVYRRACGAQPTRRGRIPT